MPALPTPTSRTNTGNPVGEPTIRPLLVRPLARFDCFGDGLCCTNIHALGPVTRPEKKALDLIEPGALVRHKDLNAPVFRTQENGSCVLRSERGCELHATRGPEAKPTGCARFPFNLVATPEGGRITTEHRCPCRTLGERPELTPEAAAPWLRDSAGRLSANGRVGAKVLIAPGKRVSFARFREEERDIIDRLLKLEDPFAVLKQKPLGRLKGMRWADVATDMIDEQDGTGYGEALVWCGNALLSLGGEKLPMSPRPWSVPFDRAQARPGRFSAEQVLADWLADMVWSLDWVFTTRNFESGRREMVTLYALALQIVDRLVRSRVRGDRAAAEAVMVVELARQSGIWEEVQAAL